MDASSKTSASLLDVKFGETSFTSIIDTVNVAEDDSCRDELSVTLEKR
jgi:hypothetical protein